MNRYQRDERPEYRAEINRLKEELAFIASALGERRSELDDTKQETDRLRNESQSLTVQIDLKKREIAKLDSNFAHHQGRIADAVLEHGRIMLLHSVELAGIANASAAAKAKLDALQVSFSQYQTLEVDFERMQQGIKDLMVQEKALRGASEKHLSDSSLRSEELKRVEEEIDAKIRENGRILRDMSNVRSDIFVYAHWLQKYYDEIGLKISVEEILNYRMPKY